MADVEVGRVTIKVTPDTKGFRKKLQKGVKEGSKGVKAPIGNDFDDKGLKSDVQKAAKKAAPKKAAAKKTQYKARPAKPTKTVGPRKQGKQGGRGGRS